MPELLKQPWPWYISGTAIAFIMILLLYYGKSFGFSSNLRTICTLAGAGKKHKFFDFDWKTQRWNLLFLLGAVAGGFLAGTVFKSHEPLQLSAATVADLKLLHIPYDGDFNPSAIFNWHYALTFRGLMILLGGGFLVGFGSRYAGGCTSGHAISGLSNLQLPSLWAVIGFIAGGLIMTHLLLPLIF
ncbi:YeeE/YedE family protein [Mucilaginibacter limnophilus]|uniref:YeeE/YedE family protein n=1 Tax=Mucilaginibacter limnophilus TaxID=1932778 RepID=A0A3S2VKY6_9SPHI|nr:YeeE/YedE thiosulfate transporter family protein [Mucilaginibacter limnophilus]RVT98437.1 YeeE/YedE family protein [Mucilaginibacter limnophilus]